MREREGRGEPDEIGVLIADDHPLVRAGLKEMLEGKAGIVVVAEAGDGREAVELAMRHRPAVALVDLQMPVVDGYRATSEISAGSPGTAVVILSARGRQGEVLRAVEAGARGYVLKGAAEAELVAAVRKAARGEIPLSPGVAGGYLLREAGVGISAGLSPREVECLSLGAEGLSPEEIAARLRVSRNTVKTHTSRAFSKLGVHSLAAAVTRAIRLGYLDDGS